VYITTEKWQWGYASTQKNNLSAYAEDHGLCPWGSILKLSRFHMIRFKKIFSGKESANLLISNQKRAFGGSNF
jgi:hypothetical protein